MRPRGIPLSDALIRYITLKMKSIIYVVLYHVSLIASSNFSSKTSIEETLDESTRELQKSDFPYTIFKDTSCFKSNIHVPITAPIFFSSEKKCTRSKLALPPSASFLTNEEIRRDKAWKVRQYKFPVRSNDRHISQVVIKCNRTVKFNNLIRKHYHSFGIEVHHDRFRVSTLMRRDLKITRNSRLDGLIENGVLTTRSIGQFYRVVLHRNGQFAFLDSHSEDPVRTNLEKGDHLILVPSGTNLAMLFKCGKMTSKLTIVRCLINEFLQTYGLLGEVMYCLIS